MLALFLLSPGEVFTVPCQLNCSPIQTRIQFPADAYKVETPMTDNDPITDK